MPTMNTSPASSNGIIEVPTTEEVRRSGRHVAKRAIFDNSTATTSPTKTTVSKPRDGDVSVGQNDAVTPPIVVRVRQGQLSVEESTEEVDDETSEDDESTIGVPRHCSDNYTKRSLYE